MSKMKVILIFLLYIAPNCPRPRNTSLEFSCENNECGCKNDISGTICDEITKINQPEKIRNITMHAANMTYLTDQTFDGFENLEILDLTDSNISQLDNNTFRAMPYLITITLSGNRIVNLSETLFQSTTLVESIQLDGNLIQIILKSTFSNLKHLRYVILAKNKITAIEKCAFGDLPLLKEVDLSNNYLTTLDIEIVGQFDTYLKKFKLEDNLFHCDSTLYPIMDLVSNEALEKTHCSTPKDQFWIDVIKSAPSPHINKTYTFEEGETGIIECKFNFPHKVHWIIKDRLHKNSTGNGTSILEIPNLTESDACTYRFVVRIDEKDNPIAQGYTTLYVTKKTTIIQDEMHTLTFPSTTTIEENLEKNSDTTFQPNSTTVKYSKTPSDIDNTPNDDNTAKIITPIIIIGAMICVPIFMLKKIRLWNRQQDGVRATYIPSSTSKYSESNSEVETDNADEESSLMNPTINNSEPESNTLTESPVN